ncbi:unnamed protein product [Effrenium voratum]|uniref:Uncharacterized protein n=1 Tax=Effrenium voratum TaxID=2562239 RepID=A0AA36HPH0_9DINO|nr:unnamed protein product [Effrenium voratum]
MSAINEIQQKLITQLDMKLEDLKPEQVARLVAAGVLTEREAALVQIRLETAKPMQAPELREVTDHGYAPTLLQGFSGTAPTLQTGKDTNAGVMKLAQVDWQQVFANCNLTYGRITSSSAFGCSSKPLFKEPTGADIKQAFRPAQVSEQELAVVLFSDKFKAHSELCSAQAYQEVCTPLAAAAAEYKSASHQEQREVGTQYSVVHKYQVPAGSFKIDTEHLELNPGFVKSVEDALSAAGNCLPEELSKFFEDRIFSTYGDVYPTEVMIGVAAFSTEVKNVTKQESKKQAADSAHVAASGIGQGVAGKGDVAAGTETASAEGAHAVNESRSWTSIGAAISDGKNPRSITSCREDSSAWRCIQYEKVASVFDFLPKNLLARVRELEQKLESQKKQSPALPPSEDLERRRLAVAAVIKGLERLDRWQHTMYQRNEKRLETGESLLDGAEHKQIKWLVGLYSGFIWNVDDNKTSAAAQRSADVLANGR